MKLKYQLRGIGIGLLVTTIILSLSHAMGDVAKSDYTPKETESAGSIIAFDKDSIGKEETTKATGDEGEGSVSESGSLGENATEKSTEKETEKETVQETQKATESSTQKATESSTTGKEVTVHIVNVYYASQASDILYNAGVITDKAAFTKYLGDNGYAEKISEGYYTVKIGDSYENIAKAITRSK